MSEQGTISTVFSIGDCADFIESDVNILDAKQSDMLRDPNAPRDALQNLRILKTRETGDEPQIPITTGRARGLSIDITRSQPYQALYMRRKAEVLKHYNKDNVTKRRNFSNVVLRKNNKSSRARIKQLIASNDCEPNKDIKKKALNSGIKNGRKVLYLNPEVPFYSNI